MPISKDWNVYNIDGLKVEIEPLDENDRFFDASNNKTINGKELEQHFLNIVRKLKDKLIEKGYKRIQIGSIAHFYHLGKTKGRFIELNTMFLARLLKR